MITKIVFGLLVSLVAGLVLLLAMANDYHRCEARGGHFDHPLGFCLDQNNNPV